MTDPCAILCAMTISDPKTDLHHYLQTARDAVLWKLEGLSEYDVRRPLVPTGTNLLGLVKHLASVDVGYFGVTFDRPFGEPLPWLDDDAEPNADLWVTAEESRPLPLPARALDTTAERPWPVRLLSAKIADYVAKMPPVWVEGQVVQLNRRTDAATGRTLQAVETFEEGRRLGPCPEGGK